jgi:hypothetical protein
MCPVFSQVHCAGRSNEASFIPHVSRHPVFIEARTAFLHGGLRAIFKRRNQKLSDLLSEVLELTQYFCSILSVKVSQKTSPDSRAREKRFQFLMGRAEKNLWPLLIKPSLVSPQLCQSDMNPDMVTVPLRPQGSPGSY